MKLKNLFIAMMASAALFAGCQKPETVTGEANVTIDPESLTFSQDESSLTVSITATRDWTVKNSTEWITEITPSEGTASNKPQTVTIKVAANEGKYRKAEIRFRAGVASATLEIIQEGPDGEVKPIEEGDGTKEHPYNASQAHQIAVELGAGKTAASPCYIKGVIHKLASKHTDDQIKQYGNGSFYISDNGESSDNDFYCFQVNYLGNTAFTSADQVKVGDEVMVYATITNFDGTCETTGKGAGYIVELNGTFNDGQADIENAESKTIADFIAAADKNTFYKLSGSVSSYKYGDYMTFDLTDATGKIYIYKITNQTDWKDKIKDGDNVTLVGKYDYYEKDKKHEVVAAQILSVDTYEGQEVSTGKVADVLAAKDGDKITLTNALVVATSPVGYVVTDAEGKDYVLAFFKDAKVDTAPAAAVGDIVNIKASKTSYAEMPQLLNPETTVVSSGNEVVRPAAEDITTGFDSFTSNAIKYVSFTGSLKIDGSYFNVNVNGASTNVGAFVAPSFDVASLAGVAGVEYTGYYIYKTGGKYIYLMLTSAGMPDGPYFIVSPTAANVPAAGGEVEINVNANVAWTASSDNSAFTVDSASGEGNGKVKVTVAENTAFEARTATITIATTEDVTTKSYAVSITQAAAANPDATVLYLTNTEISAAAQDGATGKTPTYNTATISSTSGDWTGNFGHFTDASYLQIRNNNASYLTSPRFTGELDHIVIHAVKGGFTGTNSNVRTFYAMPVVDPSKLPTGKDANNKNISYTQETFSGYYSNGGYDLKNASNETANDIELTFPDGTEQFSILVDGGAAYIDSIDVYLK